MERVYTDTSPELFELVTMEDIPETIRPVAVMIGLDAFKKLCCYTNGDNIYFPVKKTLCRKVRRRLIKKEYNGRNINELARKYGMTVKSIQNIAVTSKK